MRKIEKQFRELASVFAEKEKRSQINKKEIYRALGLLYNYGLITLVGDDLRNWTYTIRYGGKRPVKKRVRI